MDGVDDMMDGVRDDVSLVCISGFLLRKVVNERNCTGGWGWGWVG